MYTLRYKREAPYENRPHDPCVARFATEAEALAHLEDQPNANDLEVVLR